MEMKMKVEKMFWIALAAGALLASQAWGHDDDHDRDHDRGEGRPISESRPLKPDARISVDNVSGLIEVEAWDKRELSLTGTLSEDAEELRIQGDESSLSIEVKLPRVSRNPGPSTLRLRVPAGVTLEAEGVSSDIRVRGLTGPVKLDTVSGDIHADVGSRRVSAGTVSGDVEVKAPAAEETKVASVSGDVQVHGARGDLNGESVSGDLRVQGRQLRRLDLETVSGDMEVSGDFTRDADVEVETLSGRVEFSMPELPDGEVDLETFSGEIESAWPGTSRKKSRELRIEGKGKARFRLHSFSGDISLKKR
jgi:hypothetical protein